MLRNWWDNLRHKQKDSSSTGSRVEELRLDRIRQSAFQPRSHFPEEELGELAKSISEVGVIEPIIVRPGLEENTYELVVGERRWRACRLAGLDTVPAVVRDLTDAEVAIFAMTENLQREDLYFLDEAQGYRRILSEFNLTQSELAEELGVSQPAISNKIRLLSLAAEVMREIRNTGLSERHARALLQLPDVDSQSKVLHQVIDKDLTVSETQSLIKETLKQECTPPPKIQKVQGVIRDLRIFINGLHQTVEAMRDSGLDAEMEREDLGDTYRVVIEINKPDEVNESEKTKQENVQSADTED